MVRQQFSTGPTFDLEKVKVLIERALENPKSDLVFFSAPPKSTDAVIEVFRTKQGKKSKMNTERAQKFILYRMYDLRPEHFARTHAKQWPDPQRPAHIVDEYGMRYDGVPWFIKFHLDSDGDMLEAISFHPVKDDLTLANGEVLEKGWRTQ